MIHAWVRLLPRGFHAFLALADLAKVVVGIDPGLMAVGPLKLDGVVSNRVDADKLVPPRHQDWERDADFALLTLILAGSARTAAPERDHRVPTAMAIIPFNS
jgi:hypothetical protein